MRIAVCDDELYVREEVCRQIRSLMSDCEISSFDNGTDLLRDGISYDLYFLDVDMPGISGMDIAQKIFAEQKDSLIVFLTGHTEYMPDAFKVRAFRFLCKPINPQRFAEALYSAQKEIADRIMITVSDKQGCVNIRLLDLICLEAYGDGVYLYTADAVYDSKEPLKIWMDKLASHGFYRIHRAYAVSLRHILSIEPDDRVVLKDVNLNITVSRRNKSGLKSAFMAYIINHAGVCSV